MKKFFFSFLLLICSKTSFEQYFFIGSGNWATPANWAGGVPAPDNLAITDTVFIFGSGPCDHYGNLQSAGYITVSPGQILNIINGDFINTATGTMTGTGILYFKGFAFSALNSSGVIETPVKLKNKVMYLSGNTTLLDSLVLMDTSILKLNGFKLVMGGGVGGDKNNFVVTNGTGTLTRFVNNAPISFPVGANEFSYTPVTISGTIPRPLGSNRPESPASVNATFDVRVATGVLSKGTTGTAITDGVVNRTWFIGIDDPLNLTDVTLEMQWNKQDELTGFDRTFCNIAHYKSCPPPDNCVDGYYDAVSGSLASGGVAGPFTVLRNNVKGFSPFIVSSLPIVNTFIGNGDWNDPKNWSNEQVPSTTIGRGVEVIITPNNGGQCTITGDVTVLKGGALRVQSDKVLVVTGNIIVQE